MAEPVQAIAVKPDYLPLIPRTHNVGENQTLTNHSPFSTNTPWHENIYTYKIKQINAI